MGLHGSLVGSMLNWQQKCSRFRSLRRYNFWDFCSTSTTTSQPYYYEEYTDCAVLLERSDWVGEDCQLCI